MKCTYSVDFKGLEASSVWESTNIGRCERGCFQNFLASWKGDRGGYDEEATNLYCIPHVPMKRVHVGNTGPDFFIFSNAA